MNFEWVTIALGDVAWISLAFALGFLSRSIGLQPLVGFLAAGFLLNAQGVTSSPMLERLSDVGITLLLFTVGLKLKLRTLARPQVWDAAPSRRHVALQVTFGLPRPHRSKIHSTVIGQSIDFSQLINLQTDGSHRALCYVNSTNFHNLMAIDGVRTNCTHYRHWHRPAPGACKT